MNNKYSKINWKNNKEKNTYPHGKRMSAQKGSLISDYFDKWVEYIKICKHCDLKILLDDWDFQKIKTEVECDRCGYVSRFPNGKTNAKNSTPFNFNYKHQLNNENTTKANYFPTTLVALIFIISFLLGQTQYQKKIPRLVEISGNKIVINKETPQKADAKTLEIGVELESEGKLELESEGKLELESEGKLELELETENSEIKKQTIKDKIKDIEIQLLDLDVQLDMDVDIETINTKTISIKKQLLDFEQRLNSNEPEWNKTEQMMLNTKRKLKALEEKLKLEGDWGKIRLKLDPKEQYKNLYLKYQYGF